MGLPSFLASLLHEGRVRVDPALDQAGRIVVERTRELQDAAEILASFELEYRSELAYLPPPLSRDGMLWAAQNVCRACSLLAYCEFSAEQVEAALAVPCPEPASPSLVYSVDLTYRFLPDLMRLARAASPEDPLVQILKTWAQQWPLSSVGIGGVDVSGGLDFLDDHCLRQLYVDRIVAEQDESRLSEPRTRDAVAETLGRQTQLARKLAAWLVTK